MRRDPLPLILRDYLLLTVGSLCVALALNLFLIPNDVVAGGVLGIAQILRTLAGTPVGVVTLVLNVPLFALGWRFLGGATFGLRTIYATTLVSLGIDVLAPLVEPWVVREPLLYVFYGGLLDGLGVGLIFRARGTTGGIDILARMLERWRGVRPGTALLVLSAAIFVVAGWIYGPTPVLFALLVSFIAARVVDLTLEGYDLSRTALIISREHAEIREAILAQLGRGVTVLRGEGGYTAAEQPVLLCVVGRSEVSILKRLVTEIDPTAFMVISEAFEVLGEGFKALRAPQG